MEEDTDYYIPIFKEIKGIGPEFLKKILSSFGKCERAFEAPIDDFRNFTKNEGILENIARLQNDRASINARIEKFKSQLKSKKVKYLTINSKFFPPQLKNIKNPPIGIYVKGTLNLEDLRKSIAIVGTRDPSIHGHSKARKIANELAIDGYIIVSGLARGIDLESHLGALEVGGKTIAVLASGVCNIYPEEHKELSLDIIRHGALVSETWTENKATQYDLVNRNRITSGLASCTLVIEGDLDSGTRHCANFTKEQGKTIFALKPIEPNRTVAQLPLDLVKNSNAIEIEDGKEIIDAMMNQLPTEPLEWKDKTRIKEKLSQILDWNTIRKDESTLEDYNLKERIFSYFKENNDITTEFRKNSMDEDSIMIKDFKGLKDIEIILLDDGVYLNNDILREQPGVLKVLMKLLIKAIGTEMRTKRNNTTLMDFAKVE